MKRRRARLGTALLSALATAVLMALSFPPMSVKPLAWIALVPFLVALQGLSLRGRVLLGAACGVASAYAVGRWFAASISLYYQQPPAVGIGLFVFVALSMVAPYYAAFAACTGPLRRRFGPTLPLWLAAAWVAADFARGSLLTGSPFFIGNPWALIGYSQVGVDPVVQIASVTGVYGISFAIVAANAGLAELWYLARTRGLQAKRVAILTACAALPALAIWVFGTLELQRADSRAEAGAPVEIAIAQGNLDIGTRWRPEFYGANLETYLRLTLEAFRRGKPALVFWPEAAMTFFLEDEPLHRLAIARVLQRGGAQLVAGGPSSHGDGSSDYFNSTFLMSPQGELLGRYDKQYLVPFTEYFPLPQIDLLRRNFGKTRYFTPGVPGPALPSVAGPLGILTCNEAMLPEVARRRVLAGAQVLFNPSNDSWVRDDGFAAQQFDIVSLRAVETRRPLVRASTSGPSGIIDPWGRVLEQTQTRSRDLILGMLRPRSERSVYTRLGDAFAVGCVGMTGLGLVLAAARKRRTTRAT